MLKRTFLALLVLTAISVTAGLAQPATELMTYRTVAGGTEMIQRAALLPVPPPPSPAPELANVPQAALPIASAVVGYLASHAYLGDGPYGVTVQRTDGGWTIHVSVPGGDTTIFVHAPGPFIPVPTDNIPRALISVSIFRYGINNGF